jgi:signal transduction histidine kinase
MSHHDAADQTKARPPYSGIDAKTILVSLGVGIVSFLATEFMHYLLVPDIGRRWERFLAEGVSAVVVAFLIARLLHLAHKQRRAMLVRMEVISEMNHHVRNALAAIILTAESIEDRRSMQIISESVDRIEWALREVLVRRKPLQELVPEHPPSGSSRVDSTWKKSIAFPPPSNAYNSKAQIHHPGE